MENVLGLLTGVAAIFLIAVFVVPTRVRYSQSIQIAAPVASVYDAIRMQRDLMRWSAWPSATGATCTTENADGEVGARTVFFSKGKRFGYQEVTALKPSERVDFALFSAGPPQKPRIGFAVEPVSRDTTRVTMEWNNEISRPFNVLLRLFGIVRWTKQMHLKDLEGLKRFCEPPYQTYTGQPARAHTGADDVADASGFS